jgi:hypothetical protein
MAEAPSLRTSMWSIMASGNWLISTKSAPDLSESAATPARLPLSSVRVDAKPSPFSLYSAVPVFDGMALMMSAICATPLCSSCARSSTSTLTTAAKSTPRMCEPVTTTSAIDVEAAVSSGAAGSAAGSGVPEAGPAIAVAIEREATAAAIPALRFDSSRTITDSPRGL